MPLNTKDASVFMDVRRPGAVVREKGGRIGVTAYDLMNCCDDDEVPVVFEGSDAFLGTDASSLDAIGTYGTDEYPATADLVGCGCGKGADACIYAGVGPTGLTCLRFSKFRNTLLMKDMGAKRRPLRLFSPHCYLAAEPVKDEKEPAFTPSRPTLVIEMQDGAVQCIYGEQDDLEVVIWNRDAQSNVEFAGFAYTPEVFGALEECEPFPLENTPDEITEWLKARESSIASDGDEDDGDGAGSSEAGHV